MAQNQAAAQALIAQELMKVAKVAEEQVDSEIKRLENLDENDLEAVRAKRLDQLKQKQKQRETWIANGHGEYTELSNEREFFDACKKSDKLVCQFYRDSVFRCKIVDKHLRLLAQKHVETRFVHVNADKFPFLTQRLNIRVIPTIALVKDEVTVDYIRGFDELGGHDEFRTEMLEWRIAKGGVIRYSGDVNVPPLDGKPKPGSKPIFGFVSKKNVRGGDDSDSDIDAW